MNYRKKLTSIMLAVMMTVTSAPFSASCKKDYSGTYQCDWFDESIFYPYEYSDEWFLGNAFEYNHNLATLAMNISLASFNTFDKTDRDANVRKMLTECGYEVTPYGYETEGYDTAAVEMAKKQVELNGESCTLVIAAIRSGNYGMEWGGNMRIGNGETHLGFDLAKEIVLNYINSYFSANPIEGRVKLLIPGYSRGGSIANLVGSELDDGSYVNSLTGENHIAKINLRAEDTYVFTFEAPQVTQKEEVNDAVYGNIFNIMNPNDYVPRFVMSEWGYDNYGVDCYLPSADICENYTEYYERAKNVFNDMMSGTGKKFDSNFYSEEDSRSVGAMLDSLLVKIGEDVFGGKETYLEKYEDIIIFFAGQYIGKQLGAGNALKAFGVAIVGIATGIIPTHMETIKSDGFRSYIADYVAQSDASQDLTKDQIQSMIDLIVSLLEFAKNNGSDIKALLEQVNTMANVHQPYVNLSWMMAISEADMLKINEQKQKPLTVSFNDISLKYKANAKIVAEFDENSGSVMWTSDDESIVTVDESGHIYAKGGGETTVTARLCSAEGDELDSEKIKVTVYMNSIETLASKTKSFFGKAEA